MNFLWEATQLKFLEPIISDEKKFKIILNILVGFA